MRFVIICGGLEQGKDGVGDYSRLMAAELVRHGHECLILAFNDSFVSESKEEAQIVDEVSISTLRLPHSKSWAQRTELARKWIDKLNPDWISLQFVPYAFQAKGLPFRIIRTIKTLRSKSKLHFMFHELWIGIEMGSNLKDRIIGFCQKKIVGRLFDKTSPEIIHTQCSLYRHLLRGFRADTKLLPLFGNIPVAGITGRSHSTLDDQIRESLTFVLFGGIHPGAPIDSFTREAAEYGRHRGISIKLILAGRAGSERDDWIEKWRTAGLELEDVGSCSMENISRIFSSSTHGISTTPALLLEKSGSVAAMQEHGLPVICVAREWKPTGNEFFEIPSSITVYKQGLFGYCIENPPPGSPTTLRQVTTRFLADIA